VNQLDNVSLQIMIFANSNGVWFTQEGIQLDEIREEIEIREISIIVGVK